jgi:hypothetical protein
MVRLFLANLVTKFINILRAWLAWLFGLSIDDISPLHGWPGTIVTITVNGFSLDRDASVVTISSVAALVIEARLDRRFPIPSRCSAGTSA